MNIKVHCLATMLPQPGIVFIKTQAICSSSYCRRSRIRILPDPARDANRDSSCRSIRIGNLKTSKAKLRGAKYQREDKDKGVLLTVLQRCKVIIIRNGHGMSVRYMTVVG